MSLNKNVLFDFLDLLDEELEKKITLVAVGGTAMTLLNLKSSTIDVDFTIPSEDKDEYDKAILNTPHAHKIDVWEDGYVFCQALPSDYLQKSKTIKEFNNIRLLALGPIDIVVTKIGRLNERDIQDIESCIKKMHLSKAEIIDRAKLLQYAGNEKDYNYNLNYIIRRFFNKKSTLEKT